MLNFSDVTGSPDERATDNIEMRVKPSDTTSASDSGALKTARNGCSS